MSISHYAFAPLVPLTFILSVLISNDLQKGTVALGAVGIVLIVYAAACAYAREMRTPPPYAAAAVGIVVLFASASLTKTGFTLHALFGANTEWGTIASIVLFALWFLIGSASPRGALSNMLWGVELAGIIGVLVGVLAVSGLIPLGVFVASWMQLSVLFAGAAIAAAVRADSDSRSSHHFFHYFAAAASALAFFAFFSPEIALIAACCALASSFLLWLHTRSLRSASGTLALVLLLALMFGMRVPIVQLPHDQRPSLSMTMLASAPIYMSVPLDALIGSGPHTYPYVWNAHRTADMNASAQWMLTPRYSYSAFSTVLVEYGILGFAALIYLLFFPLVFLYRSGLFISRTIAPLAMLAVFLSLCMFVEQIGVTLLCILALSAGLCIRSDRFRTPHMTLVLAASIGVAMLGGALIWISARQALAERYDAQGLSLLSAKKPSEALPVLTRATDLWGASEYRDDLAAAYLRAGLAELRLKTPSNAQYYLRMSSAIAGIATSQDPQDFSRWMFSASLHIILMSNGIEGAAEKAEEALHEAEYRAPSRPDVFFERARMALAGQRIDVALRELDKALALKPDYTDAQALRAQIAPAH